ncbi:MAG: NAD(P)-dependent oxidoreductase [Methylobacteriaceae bacterium]|nr:NAD(P)-dependent oxidoreductase [Methylobacteriaceae bacterium]
MNLDATSRSAVGFVGLGRMGQGMAANLLAGGVDLCVFDTVAAAMEPLQAKGARAARSVADLAAQCDLIFTSLPGPPEVEAVVLGENGIARTMRPGTTLLELSTSARALALRIDETFRGKGCTYMDAPVSGGPAGARSGDLVLWIGGERAEVDRLAPVLKTFCIPHHVGPVGSGIVTKLAHNLLGYMLLEAQAEVFSLAVKAGLDPLDFWSAIRLGVVGKQPAINMLTQQFLPYDFGNAAFAQRLGLKDVRLGLEMADELGVPMRLAQATREDMEAVVARGEGEGDSRSFMQIQIERAGVKIGVPRERIAEALRRAPPSRP